MNARTEFRAPDKADASARLPRNEKEKPRPRDTVCVHFPYFRDDSQCYLGHAASLFRRRRRALSRQGLTLGFFTEGQKYQSDQEGEGRQSHGRAEGLKVAHASAHEESKASSHEASEIRGECKRACAALRAILLGKPEGINDEVGTSESQKKRAKDKPANGMHIHIKDVTESKPDGRRHQEIKDC